MKKIICLAVLSAFGFIACQTGKKHTPVISGPESLAADEYTVYTDRDTTLRTKQGALLKIPKGALTPESGNTAVLEIKEAYTLEQMIRYGLSTQSNGEALSSGGMIYINAAGGRNVKISKPIRVALPADYLADSMQLYRGEAGKDGKINWTQATDLPENAQLSSIQQGKQLFASKCASCHAIGENTVAPNLANLLKRKYFLKGEDGGIPVFHLNPRSRSDLPMTDSVHFHFNRSLTYHCNLVKQFRAASYLYSEIPWNEMESIFRYIQNESDRRQLPMPVHAALDDCIDSCTRYYQTMYFLQEQKNMTDAEREMLIRDNGPLVKEKTNVDEGAVTAGTQPPVNFDDMVSPGNYEAEYYQFTIELFGWYNIDILLQNVNGVQESELFVRLAGEIREKVQVYLVIPSVKVFVPGGPAERNPEEFVFQYKNGRLPLPQGTRAYILALSETRSSLAYALKEFTTAPRQELEITLGKSTVEEFQAALAIFGVAGPVIQVSETKNAAALRKIHSTRQEIDAGIKEAEKWKPKNCDCECVYYQ